MPSSWILTRQTKDGGKRYRVEYRFGGRESQTRYGGSFKRKADADERKRWIVELAARRVPDLGSLEAQQPTAPMFTTAAKLWLDSRIDVSESTKTQNRTSVNRAAKVLGRHRVDEIQARDVAAMVVQLHNEGVATGYLRKVLQAVAMTLDYAGRVKDNRDKLVVRMPRSEEEEINPPTAEQIVSVFRLLPSKHRLPAPVPRLVGCPRQRDRPHPRR